MRGRIYGNLGSRSCGVIEFAKTVTDCTVGGIAYFCVEIIHTDLQLSWRMIECAPGSICLSDPSRPQSSIRAPLLFMLLMVCCNQLTLLSW